VLKHYSTILHASWLGWAVAGGVPWLWPLLGILHFVGMSLLIGAVGAIDLRMLGVARDVPLRAIQGLLPWGLFGFGINLATGLAFYAGNPDGYQSGAFFFKMVFIGLAGVNGLLFYTSGLNHDVQTVGAGEDVPLGAKVTAVASLVFWFGVIFWGRMLTFFAGI
jgi:hypothetical protein